MLEQTTRNGQLYLSQIVNGKLKSRRVELSQVVFGPSQPLRLFFKTQDHYCVVKGRTGYVFVDGNFVKTVDNPMVLGEVYEYYYGRCRIENVECNYLTVNRPTTTCDLVADVVDFKLPTSFTGYPYDQTFSYPQELVDLLGHLPATYVDAHKRPLNYESMQQGRYFPISIDKINTRLPQLSGYDNFPVVVNLKNSRFAVIDMEPGYTPEDSALIDMSRVIYEEETPRGGKHFLVYSDDGAFKRRVTPRLEIITQTMMTFYGINAVWHGSDKEVYDTEVYSEVGGPTETKVSKTAPQHVQEMAERLLENIKVIDAGVPGIGKGDTFGHQMATTGYREHSHDPSTADFAALAALYRYDLQPLFKPRKLSTRQRAIKEACAELKVTVEELPWLLAEYSTNVIPHRDKHDTDRLGIPYLVYVAAKVIETNQT